MSGVFLHAHTLRKTLLFRAGSATPWKGDERDMQMEFEMEKQPQHAKRRAGFGKMRGKSFFGRVVPVVVLASTLLIAVGGCSGDKHGEENSGSEAEGEVSESPEAYSEVKALLRKGKMVEAKDLLQDDSSPEARFWLGRTFEFLGEKDLAISEYERAGRSELLAGITRSAVERLRNNMSPEVRGFAIATGVDEKGDPVGVADSFSSSVEEITAHITLGRLGPKHNVSVVWKDPKGEVVEDDRMPLVSPEPEALVLSKLEGLTDYVLYHKLAGVWSCSLTVDGKLMATKEFGVY